MRCEKHEKWWTSQKTDSETLKRNLKISLIKVQNYGEKYEDAKFCPQKY